MKTEYDPNDEGNAIRGLSACAICCLVGMVGIGTLVGIIIWIGKYL